MYSWFKISLRLQTELWHLETSASTLITPSLPNHNYRYGGTFLLGANECRQSGKFLCLNRLNSKSNNMNLYEPSKTNSIIGVGLSSQFFGYQNWSLSRFFFHYLKAYLKPWWLINGKNPKSLNWIFYMEAACLKSSRLKFNA